MERIKDSSLSAVLFQQLSQALESRSRGAQTVERASVFSLLPHPREIPIIRDETQIESMDGGKKRKESEG